MNREERIAEARGMVARNAPDRGAKAQQQESGIAQRLASVGASQAQRHVTAAEQPGDAEYLRPVKTPREGERAVELARTVVITRAKPMTRCVRVPGLAIPWWLRCGVGPAGSVGSAS